MIGAIAGDVLGSHYEGWSVKDKDFRLFHELGRPTDDTVLSLAVAQAILSAEDAERVPNQADYGRELRAFGRRWPNAGYGGSFRRWMEADGTEPYGSWGNGSAMRASAVGWAFDDEEEVLRQAAFSAVPTHDHPEGVKGAQAVALAVLHARRGASKEAIRAAVEDRIGYNLSRSLDAIRPAYQFQVGCAESVPEALTAFLESTDFEDAVRNAISLGGDADTQACIAGAVAEAFYGGVPPRIAAWVLPRLNEPLFAVLGLFADRHLPPSSRAAIAAEREGRLLDPMKNASGFKEFSATSRPQYCYRVVLHRQAMEAIASYNARLTADPGLAGERLRTAIGRLPVPRIDAAWLLIALLDTKAPRIFAESEVRGDGSDWTRDELGLLGDIGVAVPTLAFDDGGHRGAGVHPEPVPVTLLFVSGAHIAACRGAGADAHAAPDGKIDPVRYLRLYERRLLPLLRYASASALAAGRRAFVTVPGLGCGQFAGPLRGRLGPFFRDALAELLRRHAASLPGIRAVRLDTYDECADSRERIGVMDLLVRPLLRSSNGLPQLLRSTAYEEDGDDFSGCDLYSVVAWDHVSWPGNDFWGGARATDDGVKAAATDVMYALSGFRGRYDPRLRAYLPPEGVDTWEDLVREHRLTLRAVDNVLVIGDGEMGS